MRCDETRAHFAHGDCPGGPDETPEQPTIGHVRQARWDEWEAICAVPRCGWRCSQGNRTREQAEKHMNGHAALVHPPLIPIKRGA